ncbi:extracellular solute-binding protein family 1 [Paenibacillus curdlanolyticus YK9]|uniref:Extracellular solute-binding protein family 1 n=1 Tax=Paenibacillus curdlanolyticus YK9 TaxID=717606 RepID=E0ICQ9_9BACL|nr:ABC transporter substrate-binding protein [Paenibacillus curdlanolyticus]EFM09945.1 extracellular solute-binding protein family 1 [Paenibacillus curdlanolyticus YK9]
MHKTVWMMVIVLAVSWALAGCSSTEGENRNAEAGTTAAGSNRSETLTVLTNRVDLIENGTMRQYAARFESEHPGTTVEFQGLSNYTSDIMVRLSTRNMGDVLLLPANLMAQDLPQYFEPLPNAMFDSIRFKDYKSYEGIRYGMATGAATIGIVYNKKAFEKAGIRELPTTLTAFYAACEKLKKAGITPVYINYGAQWPMKLWGEELLGFMTGDSSYLNKMADTDNPWQVDNAWGKSMNIVQTLINKGYTESGLIANQWEISKKKIASGEAAIYFNGNWVIKQVINAGAHPEDIGFFPFPYDDGPQRYAPLVPDWFIGVSKFSSKKQLAKEWVAFFVKQSGYVEDEGYLSVKENEKISALPQVEQFLSFSPTFVESEPPSDRFLQIAEKANISLWSGEYIQEWIASKDLRKTFEQYNERWRAARALVH